MHCISTRSETKERPTRIGGKKKKERRARENAIWEEFASTRIVEVEIFEDRAGGDGGNICE